MAIIPLACDQHVIQCLCIFPLFLCLQHLWKLLVEESDLVGHLQVCEGHFIEVIVALHGEDIFVLL